MMFRLSPRSWRAALLGSVALGAMASGSGVEAASLTESLASTYNNNPTLLTQRARLRATDEAVPQALSNWRPTVQFTGQYGVSQSNSNASQAGGGGNNTIHPRSVDLSVSQPIYRGGRTVAATAQAEQLVRAERARTISVEQTVMFNTVQAYMDTLRDQSVLDLSINNEQVLKRQLEAAQDRFRVGEITRTDVAQAESRLARAQSDRQAAEGNLENSRATFERVVGEPPGRLTPPSERPVLPTSRAETISFAANNNPDVISAQFTEAAAREAVKVVRGELLPEVRVIGDINRSIEAATRGREVDTASLTARLTVPLYEGGSVYSRTRQATQTVGQRRSEIDDARRTAVEAATRAWESLQAARARVASLQTQIRAAQIALDGVQQEAAVGSRTVLDILDAEQELFSARVELVRAQRDELVNSFDVTRSIGRLTAVDLSLPVQIYDVDKYYNAVRNKWIGFGDE